MSSPLRRSSPDRVGLSHHDRCPICCRKNSACPTNGRRTCRRTFARRAGRSAQRSVFVRRAALLASPRASGPIRQSETVRGMRRRLWRDPYPTRKLGGLSALAAGSCAAMSGDRSGLASSTASPTGIRSRPSSQVKRPRDRAAKSQPHEHCPAPPLQWQPDAAEGKYDLAAQLASGRLRYALDMQRAPELNEALRVTAVQILATLPSAEAARLLNVLKLGRVTIDKTSTSRAKTSTARSSWSRSGIGRRR